AEKDLKDLRDEFDSFKREIENKRDDKHRENGDVKALEKSWQAKLDKANSDHQAELAARDAQIDKLLVDGPANALAAELSDAPELLSEIIRKRLKAENGETRVLDAN